MMSTTLCYSKTVLIPLDITALVHTYPGRAVGTVGFRSEAYHRAMDETP